jgi:anoctamin-8
LHGAEVLGIRKVLKSEFGGGKREFMFEDQLCYHGIEDEDSFLTSEERQSIVYHYLLNLRACPGETLGKVKFLEGQAIGKTKF